MTKKQARRLAVAYEAYRGAKKDIELKIWSDVLDTIQTETGVELINLHRYKTTLSDKIH